MRNQQIPVETVTTLKTVIVTYPSLEEFRKLTFEYDIVLFEDFALTPFKQQEEDVLGDADFMMRLSHAFRAGSMAEDYRQQYSIMADLLKERIKGVSDYNTFAENFHKKYIGVFAYLDDQIIKRKSGETD